MENFKDPLRRDKYKHRLQNIVQVRESKCGFSFRRRTANDGADIMSSGRLFQMLRPADENDRSPTVTRRDGRTTIVDDRRRLLHGISATRRSSSDKPWRDR